LSSIPAIFFAFDGFYSTAGIQSEMKEPRKISMAMGLGMAIVSALDIIISISLLLGTETGKMSDLPKQIPQIIFTIANICVAIGILGIINGVSVYSSRYYQDLIIHDEIPFSIFLKIHSHSSRPIMGTLVSYIITLF
jgi:amino acid transporter